MNKTFMVGMMLLFVPNPIGGQPDREPVGPDGP